VMFAFRVASTSTPARVMVATGWLLLLGALASAFTAQPKVTVTMADDHTPGAGAAGTAALWMLVAGLAVTALSLLL